MELWIRSQDGKIISKETELCIRDGVDNGRVYKSEEELKKERWEIWGYYHLLGCYGSEERALQIIDEVYTMLRPVTVYNASTPIIENLSDGVVSIKQDTNMIMQKFDYITYQMPKE